MDTPAVPPPRDAHERAIMDKLITLRDKLLLLKQDRTTYIRSQDVLPIYDQILDQVKELTSFRQQSGDTDENRRTYPDAPGLNCTDSPVDKVLESCFQLLSLLFLTIGRNQEAPAAYSLTSTIKRILDHLTECALYSEKDLQSMSTTLGRLSESIQRAATGDVPVNTSHSPYLITLLANRVSLCQTALAQLEHNLESIAPSILEKHEKCISILRCMCAANTKTKVCTLSLPPPTSLMAVLHIRGPETAEATTRSRRHTHRRQVPRRQRQRAPRRPGTHKALRPHLRRHGSRPRTVRPPAPLRTSS